MTCWVDYKQLAIFRGPDNHLLTTLLHGLRLSNLSNLCYLHNDLFGLAGVFVALTAAPCCIVRFLSSVDRTTEKARSRRAHDDPRRAKDAGVD